MEIFDEKITDLNALTKTTRTSVTIAARYYMTLLSPWTLQDKDNAQRMPGELIPVDGTTYQDFVDFMKKMNGFNESTDTF